MENTLKFIETLIEDMEGISWSIVKIVEGEKVVEDDTNYLKVEEGNIYEEQDNFYIKQWTGYCEDDYYGVIYYPIKDNKYLEIRYSC
ncbi:MAG: hypothetical protein E7A11_14460 [Clostridium sp.]|uniref:hypothetical protein n=1 Tax=Clostridium sp. TaxID=1506 RepID=UPI0029011F77|nr:hypothetical protein [Clostridium sp.]MDU1095115.1 hypothetical protein [Clostridioides difficile]MDU1126474.1 hypothetical protein [Clostridium sp.]MDU3675125.1 hypothetical protein [Clostridium sp.]MDU6873557.1 hypothetical protein [Clostridium sp.]MDU6934720.1 hypothetical protein [Clostridium sp.]